MRTTFSILSAVALVVFVATASSADSKPKGTLAQFSGSYTQSGLGSAGDLVTCPSTEGLAVSKVVFYYLEGICDDVSATPAACGGRYTGLIEECSDPSRDIKLNGLLQSVHSRGKVRMCFDNLAVSDCTGSPLSAGTKIGEGTTLTQTRNYFTPSGDQSVASATTENTLTKSFKFKDPQAGNKKRDLKKGFRHTISHVTAQPADSCAATNCGLAGSSVAVKKK